ncbi:MAG: hypothetical protein LBE62_00795 [Azonexus sp.]|jgi:hypothetical protein|nr:hypothetical protein [Azonexus sp.]
MNEYEHDLDPDLRDARLSALYRQLPPEEPSADTDAAIRAAARRAVGAGPGNRAARRYIGWFASAATVLLCFGVVMQMERETKSPDLMPEAPAISQPAVVPDAAPLEQERAAAKEFANEAAKEERVPIAKAEAAPAGEPGMAAVPPPAPAAAPALAAKPFPSAVARAPAEPPPAPEAIASPEPAQEAVASTKRAKLDPRRSDSAGQTAPQPVTAMIENIEKIIARASSDIEQGRWPEANALLKHGLDTLGDRHARSDIIDDSGMKQVAADDLERQGDLEKAARLRLKILEQRLRQFTEQP